jgi:hypothetical protein
MQNLHYVRAFLNTVVDNNRRVDQLPNSWTAHGRAADVRKIDVVDQRVPEPLGPLWKVSPGICEDALEIG